MPSNIIGPFPKKSVAPSKKVALIQTHGTHWWPVTHTHSTLNQLRRLKKEVGLLMISKNQWSRSEKKDLDDKL